MRACVCVSHCFQETPPHHRVHRPLHAQGDHPCVVSDCPTKRPQHMRISRLITVTYLLFKPYKFVSPRAQAVSRSSQVNHSVRANNTVDRLITLLFLAMTDFVVQEHYTALSCQSSVRLGGVCFDGYFFTLVSSKLQLLWLSSSS